MQNWIFITISPNLFDNLLTRIFGKMYKLFIKMSGKTTTYFT